MTLRTNRPRRDNPHSERIDCRCKAVRYSSGYLSPYFVTKTEKMIGEVEHRYILIHERIMSGSKRCCRYWRPLRGPDGRP